MLEKLGDSISEAEGKVSEKVDDSEAMSKDLVNESYKTILNILETKHHWKETRKSFDLQPYVMNTADSNVCWLCPSHAKLLNFKKYA